MTEPAQTTRLDLWASVAEVTGLALITAAAFFVSLIAGLAVAGVALFCVGFFGLARS
jgi:hypothetical protein